MEPQRRPAADAASGKRPGRLLRWLLVTLAALIVAWAVSQQAEQARQQYAALHGDADSAEAALADRLTRLPPDQRLKQLLQFADDRSPGLRFSAVDQLSAYHNIKAAEWIDAAFQDSSSEVRTQALLSMLALSRQDGVRLVSAAIKDTDSSVREAAADQASQLARQDHALASRLTGDLVTALHDPDRYVALMADASLRTVSGNPWSFKALAPAAAKDAVVARWDRWWGANQSRWKQRYPPLEAGAIQPTRSDPPPDFQVQSYDGQRITPASLHGRVVLLNFWNSGCGPCVAELPDLQRLSDTFGPRGFEVIGLGIAEPQPPAALSAWLRKRKISYVQAPSDLRLNEQFYDPDGGVPISILLDRRGMIRYRFEGERDYATYAAAVSRLLAEGG